MSDEKKGPVVVGGIDASGDPVVKQYKTGLAERAAKARAERPRVGNLAQAHEAYNPKKDRPMTISQITEAQRNAEARDGGGLSKNTVDVMMAIAQHAQTGRQQKIDTGKDPSPKEGKMEETPKPEPPKDESKERERAKTAAAVEHIDDLEFERIMRGIQNDVINNLQEKEHVNDPKNKRLSEVDFAEALATGQFTQRVEVAPGKLHVLYRSISAMETQAVRLWVFERVAADERLDRISGEMYGLGLLVASVIQIGTKQYPSHLKGGTQSTYDSEFDDAVFAEKYKQFARMPQQLLHSLGIHGQWFDERMRLLFTADHVKNG